VKKFYVFTTVTVTVVYSDDIFVSEKNEINYANTLTVWQPNLPSLLFFDLHRITINHGPVN
jgi:hypothetical protein